MAITSILRDWGVSPSIVRITTTDSLATITTAGYLTAQASNIETLNNGSFEWDVTDEVLIYYSNGQGFFTRDITNATFLAASAVPGSLANTLASGNVFVGSGANVATGVTMSADATMANTGALTIAANAITTAKIINNAVTSAKLALTTVQYATVSISAAAFNGMFATPIQLVAAAGANTLLVLDRVELVMTFNSVAFAAGGVAAVQYDSTANGAGVIASSTNAAASFQASASTSFAFNQGAVLAPFATSVNKGLFLSNITGAFTTGNSTMVAHVWYKVIPTV